jgi:heat shock protein HslJ
VLSTTRRNCPDPQSGLELRFLAALGAAAQFRFEATRLVIAYGDELRGRLVFR